MNQYFSSKRKLLASLAFLQLLSIISCQSEQKEATIQPIFYFQEDNAHQFEDKYKLSQTSEISFPLDSETSIECHSICYFESNNIKYLSLLNIINLTVYIFDYSTKQLSQKIKLETEGPNSIGSTGLYLAHFMNHPDTLLIFNNKGVPKFFFLNKEGEMISKYEYRRERKDDLVVYPMASSSNPIQKFDNKLYIHQYPYDPALANLDFSTMPSVVEYDISKNANSPTNYLFYFPEVYNQGFWTGTIFKSMSNFIWLEEQERFLVSYAIDPFLYEYDKDGVLQQKHYVSSKHFTTITPYISDPNHVRKLWERKTSPPSYEEKETWSLTNPDFSYLLKDPATDFFIRMAYVRPSIDEFKSGIKTPRYSYIIFDKNYQKVGETIIPKGYKGELYFMTNKGLHIANLKRYNDGNEDQLTFGIFQIKAF
jgi:hypothetical protein